MKVLKDVKGFNYDFGEQSFIFFFFHSRVIVYTVLFCIIVCSFPDILHFHFHFLSLINHLMVEINSHYSAWNDRSPTRSIRPDFELNYLRIAVSHLNL